MYKDNDKKIIYIIYFNLKKINCSQFGKFLLFGAKNSFPES